MLTAAAVICWVFAAGSLLYAAAVAELLSGQERTPRHGQGTSAGDEAEAKAAAEREKAVAEREKAVAQQKQAQTELATAALSVAVVLVALGLAIAAVDAKVANAHGVGTPALAATARHTR